jgi:hypothetical protein
MLHFGYRSTLYLNGAAILSLSGRWRASVAALGGFRMGDALEGVAALGGEGDEDRTLP